MNKKRTYGGTMKSELKCHARVGFVFVVFCTGLLSIGLAHAQVNKLDQGNLEETMRNPWKADQSVFLTDWLVLGSIPIGKIEEIDRDFLIDNGGEANVQPREGQVVKIGGSEMKWVSVKCKDIVDLQKFFQGSRTEDAVAYAYTKVTRKEAGKVYQAFGTDDGVKVWLNGNMVHRILRQRGLSLDEDRIEVNMNTGDNHLLLKIQQGKGGWGFAARKFDNPNLFNIITGNIEFSIVDIDAGKKELTVFSQGNLSQALFKQTVQMEVFTTGGRTIVKKSFNCAEPVILGYGSWPDGVFEFRFTYKDVRGTKSVKYSSWFKGDILAAAREIVRIAPERSMRTPEAASHRMLADMILDRLGNDLQNPDSSKFAALHMPLIEFAELKAKSQIHPGGFVRLALIDEIDNSPQFCRCYLPLNYDPSKKWPMVVYLHGYYDNNPDYIRLWDTNKKHESASDKHDVIFIEPHGRGNAQYLGMGDLDVLKCIEKAKQLFSVDNERVYLMGSSMGGFGTWNVATRHPELFAAIAPIYGGGDYHVNISKENLAKLNAWEVYLSEKSSSTAQLESLSNMPMLVSHGDQDQAVDVNLSRYLVRLLQRWNYDVRYIEVPGKGHTDLGLWDQIISWLLQHKKNAAPRLVRVRAADLRTASAYWVKVTQRTSPFKFMVVDAEVLEGNLIRVDSKNVCELSLTPDAPAIDWHKPVNVVWNGKSTLISKIGSKTMVLREDGYAPRAVRKTPHVAGPIADFQNTPFLVVKGTTSTDSLMERVIAQKAETIVNGWKTFQKCEPRVMNDVDVSAADMKTYSLLLLGGPKENSVSKQIFRKIPFQVQPDKFILDGKSFTAPDAVLDAVYPNPYNEERYVNIVVATSGAGLCFFDPFRNDLMQYDFYITDGKVAAFSLGAKNEKIMVATGFFNRSWNLDDAFVNRGDEELRSKCARVVVNADLSTKIVSSAKPSLEFLKSYTGVYQVDGGPLLTVILENDALRIAQGADLGRSLRMQPVSDNEFYVEEVKASVAFKKSEATGGFVLAVYINGQELSSKKVK